jgi:hypothetical protein
MGDSDSDKSLVDIPHYGKLSVAPKTSAALLVVFGGIDVHGVRSGIYMWKYMDGIKDRFHIFVAVSNTVNGDDAYRALKKALDEKGLAPSTQILYLFSGGWRPGVSVLRAGGRTLFSSICLVDIWMGVSKHSGSTSPDFYRALAKEYGPKITYVYTKFGANNSAARDYIAGNAGNALLVEGSGMSTHMSTNTAAVRLLP